MNAENIQYPLYFGDIIPEGDGFSRLPTPEGEAIHTGGLYLSPSGEVWKPLDVKPYANAEVRIPSREAEVLELMAHQPGFPVNWRIDQVRGRRFLVRPRCLIVGQDIHFRDLSLGSLLEIEQWIRSLNSQYWEVNDYLSIAFDERIDQLFLLDLSAAQPMDGHKSPSAWLADDTQWFYKFATQCGATNLVKLRCDARHLTSSIAWLRLEEDENSPITKNHRHIYGSRNRPVNSSWAKIPDAVYLDGDVRNTGIWTWVVTPNELSPDLVKKYELTWAYSPIPYRR